MSGIALETFLTPVTEALLPEGVTELSINGPREAWVEQSGDMRRIDLPELDHEHLKLLCDLIAEAAQQELSAEKPLLSATLPQGHRVQIVWPPAAETISISIRKPSVMQFDLAGYEATGAFEQTRQAAGPARSDPALARLLAKGQYREFVEAAIRRRLNILIAGGTSTGKTTFLNACLRAIPAHERIVTVEDAREVRLTQPNRVHLLSSRGAQGRAQVTPQQLIEACLRMRPDRIIMGELRGAEAFAFLRAINTGHPGSLATIHADTPAMAYEQLALLVLQADLGLTRPQILEYVRHVIPIVIQLDRGKAGQRYVSEIYYAGATA